MASSVTFIFIAGVLDDSSPPVAVAGLGQGPWGWTVALLSTSFTSSVGFLGWHLATGSSLCVVVAEKSVLAVVSIPWPVADFTCTPLASGAKATFTLSESIPGFCIRSSVGFAFAAEDDFELWVICRWSMRLRHAGVVTGGHSK